MAIFGDVAGEVEGRNRELRQLTASAAKGTRSAFDKYIDLLGQAQLQGDKFTESERLETLRANLQAISSVSISSAEAELQRLLRTTDRRRALDLLKVRSMPEGPKYARFAWILGVSGAQSSSETGTLDDFLRGAAALHAESLIALLANPEESSLLRIAPAARHGRMEAGSIRFVWVCNLFAEAIDEWATNLGETAKDYFGNGRTRRLSAAIQRELPFPTESVLSDMHPNVLAALTAAPRPGATVTDLIEGNGPEIRPLLQLDDQTLIGNVAAMVFDLDVVLISAIKETLGSNAQGDAFEFACGYIASRLLPPSIHVARDSFVSDTMTATTGDEVDLHLYGKGLHVIVEAKSHLPAKDASSAANSYDELLKANKQVERRVSRLRSGKWIRRTRTRQGDTVSGLVISLHDYTSQVWVPESMAESGVESFVAMPLHAFAMAAGCVRSPSELKDFLDVRFALGAASVSGGDELEVLLGWLSGWKPETIPQEPGSKVMVRPYAIDTDSLISAKWTGANAWREYLFEASSAIH